jgi:tRNA U34 2-thiouridine synthase MnmA/TrmU
MFRTLKHYLDEYKADFIVSGEVLNQRPMSQRHDALNAVKKLSGIGDLIIRPLSQKRLSDTMPIREGWVKKDDLLGIVGRSRAEQLKIAEEFGLKEIENSGGGCLLTDKGYTQRLKEIIDHGQLDLQNIKFLQVGRHFRINNNTKLVINRHINELEYLHTLIKDEIVIKCLNVPGPIGIIVSNLPISEEILCIAGSILLRYCPKANDTEMISYGKQFNLTNKISCNRYEDCQIDKYRVN